METSPWAWDPGWAEIAALLALAASYGLSLRRYPAPLWRRLAFCGGIVLALAIFVTPLQTLATTYLLSGHLLQNVVLAEWTPALLVLGVGPALADRLAQIGAVRFVTRPFVALPLWLATYAVWHVPAVYDAALARQAWLLPLEHACYLAAGLVFWWPVLQDVPHRIRSGVKAAYVFAAFLLASPMGLLLALIPSPIYDFYETAPRIWGVSAIRDQQLAGMLMSATEAIVFFGVFTVFVLRFLREEDAPDVRAGVSR